MSIRGIDTQIMVNRTLELAKDASAIQRREQVASEQFAQQLKISTEEQSSQVQDVQETEGGRIQNEEQEKDRSGRGSQQEQDSDASEEEQLYMRDGQLDASLKPGADDSGMRIDIRV